MIYTPEYLEDVKIRFPIGLIKNELDRLRGLKVVVIGDAIVDRYVFTLPKGRATKDPILSLDFEKSESYAGGILAIANHIAGFVDSVRLVSVLGDKRRQEGFVAANVMRNINAKFFTKRNSPTTTKIRYIDSIRHGKLFKVQYINDEPLDAETEEEVIAYLKEELPKHDLVVVGDFGHGFITPRIVRTLEQCSQFLAVNVQTNSSNMGFNYVHKFGRIEYLTTNEFELRLALCDRFGPLPGLIDELKRRIKLRNILLTLGGEGCAYITSDNSSQGPSLTANLKDVVGAGDAVFAITTLLDYNEVDEDLLVFVANSAGAIAVQTMGNEESITKERLLDFIGGLK